MPDDLLHDVFLSHSAKDKAVVWPLADRLRTRRAVAARRRRKDGLKVWPVAPKRPRVGGFDEWVLKPGDSIPAKIDPPALISFGGTGEGLEPSYFGFRTSDFGFAQPGMSAQAFGSDWAQLACPAVASVRRRKADTCERRNLRFRDPLNAELTP